MYIYICNLWTVCPCLICDLLDGGCETERLRLILDIFDIRLDTNEGSDRGGYVFFETSSLPHLNEGLNTVSAMMESPLLSSTGNTFFSGIECCSILFTGIFFFLFHTLFLPRRMCCKVSTPVRSSFHELSN